MAKKWDYIVKYNPKVDTQEDVAKRILYSIIIRNRLKARKPCVMFVGGDSGEGKSITCLALQKILLEIQGLDINQFYKDINVFIPIEYPEKLKRLLFEKELKKVNILCIHEARTVIKAKLWHSFINQSIADVNAMSRSVKRICTMVVSQFIRDISTDIRYTLNFYCKVTRPTGRKARLYINVMWKDDYDLEKPRLRKRKLIGLLKYPNGRYRVFSPKYIEFTMPDKELVKMFEDEDFKAKAVIIKKKIKELIQEMKNDIGEENTKIRDMVDWYSKNVDNLMNIGKRRKGKWIINKEVREMHQLNKDEAKEFQKLLNDKLVEKGILNPESEV